MLKASLIGNLGADPEMRYSASGSPFLRFNVASNFRSKNQAGEWEDRTEWCRVTVTGARAERLGEMLKKGSRVFVDGRLEARPWTDSRSEIKAGLEVMADSVEFMSSREQDAGQRQPAPVGTSANDTRPIVPNGGAPVADDQLPF